MLLKMMGEVALFLSLKKKKKKKHFCLVNQNET